MSNGGLADYIDLPDEELYGILGRQLLGGGGLGVAPDDQGDDAARFGRTWFRGFHATLQEKVCGSPRIQPFLGSSGSDRLVDAATIYQLVQDLGDDSVNYFVVAVLIGRIGLGTFCAGVPARS